MLDFLDTKKKLPGIKPVRSTMVTEWPWERHLYAKFLREVHGLQWGQIENAIGIPPDTMKRWAKEEGWLQKGGSAGEMSDFSRQQFLRMAEGNGMPKHRAVQLLVEGMTKPTVSVIREEIGEDGKKEMTAVTEPDYDTRHKYQKDYWVIVGLCSTGGKGGTEINNLGSGTVNVQVIIPAKVPAA